jgi:DNA-binding SARP family transcriptional activator/WD40 repeat protein
VDFRILGPLEVVHDNEPLVLGAAQQRALLAVLVLHRGEAVSIDRLIDELWGERAPATAAKTVQVYVSQLRKALGAGVIVTHGRGYRLAVDPEQVDAGQFEALRAEGRRALAEGDAARAKDRLCSALGLWRGEPLADFAYEPFAQGAIGRLQEARLAALEDRIEAELALGSDGELIPELESLVASNPLQERLRGQLMLALYRKGRQADALAAYRQTSELLREELGLEPSRMLQELERSILEHDSSLDATGVIATRGVSVGVCPFKGLAFFDRADADYFCGRERVVSDLLARLVESTLVGTLGPSGIGKSSLLRAGVLPALSAGSLPGSAGWRQVLLRPGVHPRAELGRALDGDRLGQVLGQLSPGERLVIAVDQLEELFTLCEQEDERAAFLDQLAAAARDPARRALVVVSLRADFYGRVASYPRFAGPLSRSHVLVGPMDREELARAIEEPAGRAGLELERGLADALVSDVIGEPGGLPLLSTTLLELWRARDGRVLRYESYRRSGGVRGAVARLAEAGYAQLGESERRIARGVMLRLASGEAGALARRRVPLSELERIDGAAPVLAELTDARLLTVSDGEVELSHEALLSEWPRYRGWLEEDRIGRRLHAHLTAAASDWDARDRDPGELYRGPRLASALDWAAQHDDQLNALEREFIQTSRLESDRVARRQRAQNRRLRGLLVGVGVLSVCAVIAGVVALVQRQSARHEASAATTAARVSLARQLGAQAVNEPRLDRAMLLAREAVNLNRSPETESSLLATLQRSPAAIGTVALPINGPPQQLALSPDGRTLAVGGVNLDQLYTGNSGASVGELRFYDARTNESRGRLLTDFGGARAPIYSSDGSLLLYPTQGAPEGDAFYKANGASTPAGEAPEFGVSNPLSIAVRNAHTLTLMRDLTFDPAQAVRASPDLPRADILIAPDGRAVYCAYRGFTVARGFGATYLTGWSLPSGRLLPTKRIDRAAVLAVGLIDAGARVAVVDARAVAVFDARSLRRLSSVAITPAPAAPAAAAISPDGRAIAISSPTGAVSFVDVASGDARPGAGPSTGSAASLAYSSDARAVASAANNTVIIWDPQSAMPREVLSIPGGQVQGVAFSPDGDTLYTSSVGGLVLEWDLSGERSFGRRFALSRPSSCCNPVASLAPPLALSPDGTTFAVRLGISTVGLFSARTLQRRGSFTVKPENAVITALAWSPTAPQLAVGGSSGLVQLWRTDGTPRRARSLRGLQPILGKPEAIQALSFSPDGRLIAASDNSETVVHVDSGSRDPVHPNDRLASLAIWNASSGKLSAPVKDLETGSARFDPLTFSTGGRLIAVSTPDGRDLVLDATTAQTRQTLRPIGREYTASLAFAPNGTLATGTLSGIVQLWNPISGQQVAGPLPVTAGPISSIAFDPGGRRFATTGSQDGAVKLWSTSTLRQDGTTLNTDQRAAAAAVFEPHGNSLLVVDSHGSGFSWPTSLAAWERRACTVAGRNLTRGEWARFVTGHAYAKVCP